VAVDRGVRVGPDAVRGARRFADRLRHAPPRVLAAILDGRVEFKKVGDDEFLMRVME
jgi:hypothetical protein